LLTNRTLTTLNKQNLIQRAEQWRNQISPN